MSDYLFSHWGKADFEDSHPAVLHMIDVAVTADAMLGNSKSGFLKYLSRYISAEGKSDISQWIAFIAALHDLGKISPGFQNKRADLVSESLKSNLKMKSIGDCDHCEVTYISICDSFGGYCRDIDTCEVIAYVLSAHHGSFKLPGGYSDGEWKS